MSVHLLELFEVAPLGTKCPKCGGSHTPVFVLAELQAEADSAFGKGGGLCLVCLRGEIGYVVPSGVGAGEVFRVFTKYINEKCRDCREPARDGLYVVAVSEKEAQKHYEAHGALCKACIVDSLLELPHKILRYS